MQTTRLFFIFLIFFLLIGWGMWTISAAEQENTKTLAIETLSSPEYNLVLHDLFYERATLINSHLANIYEGRDISETSLELSTNTQKLGDIVEVLSNEEDKNKFVTTLQEQLKAHELYALGLQERDNSKLELSQQMLNANSTDFGDVLHTVFPTIPDDRGASLIEEQNSTMVGIMIANATKDDEKQFELTKDSTVQADRMADELINAIRLEKEQQGK